MPYSSAKPVQNLSYDVTSKKWLPTPRIQTGADGTQNVDVVSSTLPTGASTSDNQTNGSQKAEITFNPSNQSAFGTLEVSGLTPVFQGDFVFGVSDQQWKQSFTFTITEPATHPLVGDQYTNSNNIYTIISSSGTTLKAYGSGLPAASGNLVRATGVGTTPIAYSAYVKRVGVATGTGAEVDTNAGRLRIQSGTSSTGYAHIQTRRPIRYRAGQGQIIRFTPLFTTGVADNIQLWGMGNTVDGTVYDGYFFGYNGTVFSICHYNRGTPAWTAQASWNGGTLPFTWNPTFGTPVMIKYPYLGYGNILFFVQNPSTGGWVLAHQIKYANTTATTQLSNPTMSFMGITINSGNTTNMTMYLGSVGMFISGERSFVGNPKWSSVVTLATVTTENNIITLRNANTYNGTSNKGLMRLTDLSFSSSAGSGVAFFRIKIGATLGGTAVYTPVNGSTADNGGTITSGGSFMSFDVAGTTVTGGTLIHSTVVDNPGTVTDDMTYHEIYLAPGETMTISAYSTLSSTIGISVNWTEDV